MNKASHFTGWTYRTFGVMVLCLTLWVSAASAQPRVLVLHSYDAELSWTRSIQQGIAAGLKEAGVDPSLTVEYLDTKRHPDATYLRDLLPTMLQHKLAGTRFDLVIVSDNNAFDFALEHRDALLQGAPVVFCGVNYFVPDMLQGQGGVTGVAEYPSFYETIQLARQLDPAVREVVVIGSRKGVTAEKNRRLLQEAESRLPADLHLTYWDDVPAEQLPRRLALLRSEQVVLLTSLVRRTDGSVLDFPQTARLVRQAAPVPVYGPWDFFLGEGILGGKLIVGHEQGRLAATMAARILRGEIPEQIPVVRDAANRYRVDARELARFDIDSARLPQGTQIHFAPKAFYEFSPETVQVATALVALLVLALLILGVNIRMRMRSQQALSRQTAFLQTVIDTIPIPLFYKDRLGRYLGCNQAMESFFGLPRDRFIGKSVGQLYPPDEARIYLEKDDELFENGGIQIYEHTMTTSDGRRHEVLFHKATYASEGTTEVDGLVGSILDLTDRKQAERALRASEHNSRMLFEHSPIGLAVCRADGTLIDVNPAVARILGRPLTDLLGKALTDITPDRYLARQNECLATVRDGRAFGPIDLELIHGHGHCVPVHFGGVPIERDGEPMVLCSLEDMTARRRATEALRQSEERFRTTFETTPDAICINRLKDGLYVEVNRGFTELTGIERRDALGRTALELNVWVDTKARETFIERLTRLSAIRNYETQFQQKSGASVPVLVSARIIQIGGERFVLSVIKNIEDIRRSQETLRQSEERLRIIFETSPDAITITRLTDGKYYETNPGFTQLTGYSRDEALAQGSLEMGLFFDPEDRSRITSTLLETGEVRNYDTTWCRRDGSRVRVLISAQLIEVKGETLILGIIKDIEALKRAQDKLADNERRYRQIFENIQDVYYESGLDGVILEMSPSVAQQLGYDRAEILGINFNTLYVDPKRRDEMVQALRRQGWIRDYEIALFGKDRRERPCSINAVLVRDEEGQEKITGSLRDITARKIAEEQTRKLAYYDTLTGLPNRTLFNDRLTQALAHAQRHGETLGLLFLDLDRFKDINDTLGHASGDALLRQTAERLKACVRSSDTVARLGGDEFVLMVNGVTSDRELLLVAQKVLRTMAMPVELEGQEIFTTTSIGIVLAPTDGDEADILMKHADMAMYAAKEQGRNTYKFFSHDMNRKAMERHALEVSLRRAIRQKEFFLDYQPQMDLETGRMLGVEALLRWRDPVLGLIPPARFIPVAEETGLIRVIGEWVLREACSQSCAWLEEFGTRVKVAVNLSAHQFKQPDFLDIVEHILQETGLPPDLLELELTESVLMENARDTIAILTDLKIRGVKLAIDDFGTGYSSLAYLKNFPIDRIKIDRSFVLDITTDPNDAAIVETIIAMAGSLGLRVVAEGVETPEQLEFLRTHGCDEVQGFYLGRPTSAEKIVALFSAGFNRGNVCLFEGPVAQSS